MKVQTQDLPDGEVAVSFDIDDARFEHAMEVAYRRAANRVSIAGFRRGKAPRQLVERVVGRESLVEEALNQLLPEAFQEVARETNIVALTDPEFDVESLSPLRAKARIVVPPSVELGDYRAIRRSIPDVSVDEAEVDAVVQQLRESHGEWVPVERPAEIGDRVAIDVVGRAEGSTVINQDDVEYVLRPESPVPVPGFAQQLVGASTGEARSFELAATEGDETLVEKTIAFGVTVKDVKVKELPELDDDFASTVGEHANVQELLDSIRQRLRERGEATAREKVEQEILDEAIGSSMLTIPERLTDQQTHRIGDRLARDLDSGGLSIEQYLQIRRIGADELDAELRSQADRSLRRRFVLEAIAEHENLAVDDDAVDHGIRDAMGAEGADRRAVEQAFQQSEVRERVRSALREERAAKWLVEHATREETPAVGPGDPESTQDDS